MKYTNHTQGPRGINLKSGTRWIEPGESVELDKAEIVGELPDLGKASDAKADSDADDRVTALEAEIAKLKKQGETDAATITGHVKTIGDRDAEIAKLKKPA